MTINKEREKRQQKLEKIDPTISYNREMRQQMWEWED
jgi:hypothetical protein